MTQQQHYRQQHLDTEEYGANEPNYERALVFFRQLSVVRQMTASQQSQLNQQFPALYFFERVKYRLLAANKQRSRDKTSRGLLDHLADLLIWNRMARFTDYKDTACMDRIPIIRNTSSVEIGRRVDTQIAWISSGLPFEEQSLHHYTRWFIQYIYQRSWLICGTQLPLWSVDRVRSVHTSCDVICYDLVYHRFVLVELKTGYDRDYENELRPPLPGDIKPDSFYWRHQFQLGWMHYQLAEQLKFEDAPLYAIVLRINGTGGVNAPHPLEPFVKDYFANEYERYAHTTYLADSGNSMDPHTA